MPAPLDFYFEFASPYGYLASLQIDAIAAENKIDNGAATIKLLSEKQPSQQFVQPEDIGGMVLFLCSSAAAQITGTALSIDGGWTAA